MKTNCSRIDESFTDYLYEPYSKKPVKKKVNKDKSLISDEDNNSAV